MFMLSRKRVSIPRREGTDVCHRPRCQSPSYPIPNTQYHHLDQIQTALNVPTPLYVFKTYTLYFSSAFLYYIFLHTRDPCPEVLQHFLSFQACFTTSTCQTWPFITFYHRYGRGTCTEICALFWHGMWYRRLSERDVLMNCIGRNCLRRELHLQLSSNMSCLLYLDDIWLYVWA